MHGLLSLVALGTIVSFLAACSLRGGTSGELRPPVQVASFGTAPGGKAAKLYTLTNSKGMIAKITDFGATLVELHVPDKAGNRVDVVLGFDDVSGYASADNPYFGCTVGRVANRIALGRFELEGKQYKLATNNEPNHLHGGKVGFSHRLWDSEEHWSKEGPAVKFTYTSPDGEEGYPGTLKVTTIYTLTEKNELKIEMLAETDAPTPVNLCNHTYWNIGGHRSGNVLEDRLELEASRYTPTDDTLIPTGEIAAVKNTPLDFTRGKAIGQDIRAYKTEKQAAITGGGYDANLVVDGRDPFKLRKVAVLRDDQSSRKMTLYANQPGVQLYTGNWLSDLKGKGGAVYHQHAGVCLETQKFPDSINRSEFPSVVLRPGEHYQHVMVHRFDW
jgi:aldose 1-epimerase